MKIHLALLELLHIFLHTYRQTELQKYNAKILTITTRLWIYLCLYLARSFHVNYT